ncbi:Pimeloyl-ACP methyl ester carboxylesterase [Lentzea xinjiangensis]|uniref:Pimeloyl-ACP methyl ester carboxylesterase n=1 Tax=Lentzea xinjiangensis TaxID=402600 RepID=A0A1H9RCY2_9PSEU|nr:alpha/beta fold hydrolase [Lentzea xinjiangensis]SER70528.1 Pimeloyl-ACP methyl ester carboxylesterase [Lentzea xinjiangensis]
MPHARAADGTALFYSVEGSGPALLLIAGQSNSSRWWSRVRPAFAERFTTIVTDHRGTGASDKPDIPYSTRLFASDCVAVLDAAGVAKAHVYGTSMGGRIAQWLAASHGERVDRLVLGCTSPGGPHAIERSAEVRRSLAQADPMKARRALEELMYTPAYRGPFNTLGDPDMPPYARKRHLFASAEHDAWDVLPSITAPTLVVHGTDDVFNPAANAPLITERIPGARMHLIEGARHGYFEEFASVATPLVVDFLSR